MMDFLFELGTFIAKAIIVIVLIYLILALVTKVLSRAKLLSEKNKKESHITFIDYKAKRKEVRQKLEEKLTSQEEFKIIEKAIEKYKKSLQKLAKKVKEQDKEQKVTQDKVQEAKSLKPDAEDKNQQEERVSSQADTESQDVTNLDNNDKFKAEKRAIAEKIAAQYNELLQKASKDSGIKLVYEDDNFIVKSKVLFILDFVGSTLATEVKDLRRAIDIITYEGSEGDGVILRLQSPGGTVCGYGLCAAELERLKKKKINLTIAVDQVAASGGYMMASVADKIVAAPFAYIGSIGVVSEFPNFNRLLKKYDVEYEQVTAGKYKRTLGQFAENTPEGREKFKEELEDIHKAFKEHVKQHRPNVDIEQVATGEHWIAKDALKLGLVDEIMTSDECIEAVYDNYDRIIQIDFIDQKPKGLLSVLTDRSELVEFCSELVSKFTRPKV